MNGGRKVEVRCYSGHTYAQRPVAFYLEGEEYQVKEVLKTWREPRRVLFSVATAEGRAFTLAYDEGNDDWHLANGE